MHSPISRGFTLLLLVLATNTVSADDRGPLVYIDLMSLGVGAAQAQIHIRTGIESGEPWGMAWEAGLAWSGDQTTAVYQIDLATVVRHREGPGPNWGLGVGLLTIVGSSGQASMFSVQALALAEMGWNLGSGAWTVEPYARGVLKAGPTITKGRDDSWKAQAAVVPTLGFRVAVYLPKGGNP